MKQILLLVVASTSLLFAATGEEALRVPIHCNKPDRLLTSSWPVTFGIPFKQGEQRSANDLCIVDEQGAAVPCQIVKTGDWTDGWLRWVQADFKAEFGRQYFLSQGKGTEATDDIKLQQSE